MFLESQAYAFDRSARGSLGAHAGDAAILAPMPGKVTGVDVAIGESVTKGQRLLTLKAMKMEHALTAPFDGIVTDLAAVQAGHVAEGVLLARIEPTNSGE